ncbi:hypothetical protein Mapa_012561 [Marchantia paleacea]|nr:hypothetical protein Mapa_012561 [Marchantia paleacea]
MNRPVAHSHGRKGSGLMSEKIANQPHESDITTNPTQGRGASREQGLRLVGSGQRRVVVRREKRVVIGIESGGRQIRRRFQQVLHAVVQSDLMVREGRLGGRHVRHGHDPGQNVHHLAHGRPVVGVGMRAQQPEQQQQLGLRLVELVLEPGVHHAQQLAGVQLAPDPVHQNGLVRRQPLVEGHSAAGHLERHGPEGIHVGLVREAAGDGHLGRDVAEGARHHGGGRVLVPVHHAGEPEVSEHGVEVLIQHDVAGLDVPVDDLLPPALVQIVQRVGHPGDDPEAVLPRQHPLVLVEERLVQAAVGHELVDEQQLVAVAAPSQQADDVAVPELADDGDLGHELALALLRVVAHALDGHGLLGLGHDAPVHAPEPALAQLGLLAEAVGGGAELLVAEAQAVGDAHQVLHVLEGLGVRGVLALPDAEADQQRREHHQDHGAHHEAHHQVLLLVVRQHGEAPVVDGVEVVAAAEPVGAREAHVHGPAVVEHVHEQQRVVEEGVRGPGIVLADAHLQIARHGVQVYPCVHGLASVQDDAHVRGIA